MAELVSIVVPLYNRKKTFLRALESIYAQTYPFLELIIVDDGSTEFNIIEMDMPVHPQISLKKIRQENRGAQAARNVGFAKGSGDFVLFWDADVIAKPNFLSELYETLQLHPEAGYAYPNFSWGVQKMKSREFDPELLKRENYIHISCLIRRSVFMPFDETIKKFQDWDQWLSMLERGIVGVWVDEYLYKVLPGGVISTWLPRCAYQAPWKYMPFVRPIVKKYEEGREIIQKKHGLL